MDNVQARNLEAENLADNLLMGVEIAVLLTCGLLGASQIIQMRKNFNHIKKNNEYKEFLNKHNKPLSINEANNELNLNKTGSRLVYLSGRAVSG